MTQASTPAVHCRMEDRGDLGLIAHLTVDHQARLNILNTPLIEKLTAELVTLRADPRLRVVVLRGAGERAFIGGADINEMAGLEVATAEAFISRLHGLCAALRDLPVPVIARISGYCLGAGLEVAAACDLRVADESSVLGMPEVKVGIPSVIEAALLPTLIGWGKTRELLYTGDSIPAEEALACGFLERVVTRADLDATVERWISSILAAGPSAIRLQKRLIREWEGLPLEKAIERGIKIFGESFRTPEPHSRMRAFLDRKRH